MPILLKNINIVSLWAMNISEVFSPAPANVMLFNLQAEGAVCNKSCDAAWNHKSHCVQLFRPENNWSPDWAWFLPSFFPSIPITWRSFGSLARSHLAWNLTELNLFHNWQILQHQHFFFQLKVCGVLGDFGALEMFWHALTFVLISATVTYYWSTGHFLWGG